ncbi:MAG: hypothetical protein ACFFD4_15205 [Candidatus Odinarchaeota archaeon]
MNAAPENISGKNPHGLCTWDDSSDCNSCENKGSLNCKWNSKVLMHFYKISLPFMVPAFLGLVIVGFAGNWLPLIAYIAFWIFFFIFFEIFVLCRHCPYYAENGRILHCHANHGIPKLWKYHPGPANAFEKLGLLAGLVFFLFFPLLAELLGIQVSLEKTPPDITTAVILVVLAAITLITAVIFAVLLVRNLCPRCVNFTCPLNRVPKAIRDKYLERNPIMREAWVKSGYKLG